MALLAERCCRIFPGYKHAAPPEHNQDVKFIAFSDGCYLESRVAAQTSSAAGELLRRRRSL